MVKPPLAAEAADNGTDHDHASQQDDPPGGPDCGICSFILCVFDLEFRVWLGSSTNVHERRFPPLQCRNSGYPAHYGLHGQAAPQPEPRLQGGVGSRTRHAIIALFRDNRRFCDLQIFANGCGLAGQDRRIRPTLTLRVAKPLFFLINPNILFIRL